MKFNLHNTIIIGMHRVKMYHLNRQVRFVIMTSVFDTPEKINSIYDLKGSTLGRESSEAQRKNNCVLKDKDLLNDGRKLYLGSKKKEFMKQLSRDAKFLADLNIMDYSLLVSMKMICDYFLIKILHVIFVSMDIMEI